MSRDETLSTRDLASRPATEDDASAGHRDASSEHHDTSAEHHDASSERDPAGLDDHGGTTTDSRAGAETEVRDGTTADAHDGAPADARDGATAGASRDDSTAREAGDGEPRLLPEDQGSEFQGRWESIQTTFVDDPRSAVENADSLVADLMQQLANGFAHEREKLEGQWSRGEDVSTEDLRVVLQRYRSFFQRLLAA
jgi:hypothetical protein